MRRGRPSVYSREIAEAICERVRKGATLHAAAHANGITRETLRAWTYDHEDFSVMLMCAEGEAEIAYSNVLYDTATGEKQGDGWRPATEALKRRFRASGWGDTLDVRKMDAELLRALLETQTEATVTDQPAIEDAFDVL